MVLAMNVLNTKLISLFSISNMHDEILIKKLLLTHDPDGRRLDSETLLHAVGNIMFHASTMLVASNLYSASFQFQKKDVSEIETLDSCEPVGLIITKICKILCKCSGEGDINSKIMSLFDLIGKYTWDAKAVLVLAAFAARYGEFWLLMRLHHDNNLASLISSIKQLPWNLRPLKPQIKALSLLVKIMMDVAMCIIKFESLPLQYVELGNDTFLVTKSLIYEAVYWITRSCLTCFSQVMDFTAKKHEYSDSIIISAWELSSLAYRLSDICSILKGQVDMCHNEIEGYLFDRLLNLFHEEHLDNQKVLNLLFPTKNYLPLKDCSTQVKLGASELKNKIVLLLISKPQLLPMEELFLLVQQTCDHPLNEKLKESYKIVWIPLPSSDTWTEAEESSFNSFSDFLPWCAVRKPMLLNSAVVKYIREQWKYKDEPIMVVLDSNGKVTNFNALDMIKIWGAKGYPFSTSKEAELWQHQNLTMHFLLADINPLLTHLVEQGKIICLYGSENTVWIQQFNDNIAKLKGLGIQLEAIYVGNRHLGENVRKIMTRSGKRNLSDPLSFTNVQFFWLRLESMRRSKLQLGKTPSSDNVLEELQALVNMDDREEGWALIGSGSSSEIFRFQGMQVMEFLRNYPKWGENIDNLGLFGAPRNFLDHTFLAGNCNHSYLVPSSESEGLIQGTVICQVCKCPMKKFVVYQP